MRLTKQIRAQILKDLMAHAFDAEDKKLEKLENKLADMIYDLKYPKEIKKAMTVIGTKGLTTAQNVGFKLEGDPNWRVRYLRTSQCQLDLLAMQNPVIDGSEADEIRELLSAKEKLSDLRVKTREHAEGVLNSVTTTKRLIEVWPEVEKFVPKDESTTSNLPALQLEHLNNVLGLPPETK